MASSVQEWLVSVMLGTAVLSKAGRDRLGVLHQVSARRTRQEKLCKAGSCVFRPCKTRPVRVGRGKNPSLLL